MRFDLWTFALQAANFLVLLWLLRRFLFRPVLKVIKARQAEAANVVAEAASEKESAEALGRELELRKVSIERERDALLKAAREVADAERKAVLAQAAKDADAAMVAARAATEAERAQAVRTLSHDAATLAAAMTRRLLERAPVEACQARMIDLICDDLRALPSDLRLRIRERVAKTGSGPELVTAAPLEADERARLANEVADAIGAPGDPSFRVEPDLIAGVEIRLPFTVLRRTWSGDLARLEAECRP